MFNKKKLKLLFFIFFLNLATFFVTDYFARYNEAQSINKIFIKELSDYSILLDKNNIQTVKTLMVGFLYPEILDAANIKNIKNKKYLCPAWNQGLEQIITRQFNLNNYSDIKTDIKKIEQEKLFNKGSFNMYELCK